MSMNIMNKFDFGTCDREHFRLSPYGLAIRNSTGSWVSYDPATGKIIEVDIFNFGSGKYFFKMPVAVKDVKVGDIIVHNTKPVFVTEIAGTNISVVDPFASEAKTVIPARSPFGFDFVTKIISPFNATLFGDCAPTNDNPFGNMWMLAVIDDTDTNLLPLMLMSQGATIGNNPMLMYALMSDNKTQNNLLPLMFMSQFSGQKC